MASLFPGQSPTLVNAYLSAFGVKAIYTAAKTADGPTFLGMTVDGLLRSAPGNIVFAIWAPLVRIEALHAEVLSLLRPRLMLDKPQWYRIAPYDAQVEIMRSVDVAGIEITSHKEIAQRVTKALERIDLHFDRLRVAGKLQEFNAEFKRKRAEGCKQNYGQAVAELKGRILADLASREA